MNSTSLISGNGNFDVEEYEESSLNQNDFQGDDNQNGNFINFPIKSISIITESNTNLLENNINSTVSEYIENYIKDLNFEIVSSFENNNTLNNRRQLNNYNLNNNNNYKRKLSIDNFNQPIHFAYPIFKSNIIGIKIGMYATLHFYPSIGVTSLEIKYKVDNTEKLLVNYKEITQLGEALNIYSEIVEKISTNINIAANRIKTLFNTKRDNVWKTNLINELLNISKYLLSVNDVTNIFSEPLNTLINDIKICSKTTFDKVFDEISKCENNLLSFEESVNNENEDNLKNIISSINESLKSTSTINQEELIQFHEYVIEVMDSIIEINDYSADIVNYYDLMNFLNDNQKIYNIFEEKYSEINEDTSLKLYSNILFKSDLEHLIIQDEFIAKRLQNNKTLIEAINDDSKRNEKIKSLNNIRGKVLDIINVLNNKIDNIYSNYNTNGIANLYLEPINGMKNEFIEKKNSLDLHLKEMIEGLNNSLNYIKDLNILFQIDYKVSLSRNTNLYNMIISPINNIKGIFISTDKLINISNSVDEIINEIKINEESGFLNIPELIYQLKQEFNKNKLEYLEDNLVKRIYGFYNISSLQTYILEYYNQIKTIFNEYDLIFYQQNFMQHLDDYFINPNILFKKLNQSLINQQAYNTNISHLITESLKNKINNKIIESYNLYSNIIQSYLENIKTLILNKEYTGDSLNRINLIFTTFDDIIENIKQSNKTYLDNSNQNNIMGIQNNEDPFNINENITKYENEMIQILNDVIENVNNKYIEKTLKDNQGSLDGFSLRNFYYVTVLEIISQFKNIISYSKNSNNFNLKVNEYIELFKNNTDYRKNYIINEIYSSLNDFNNEEKEFINPTINLIKSNISESIEKNINQGLIESKLKILSLNTFKTPSIPNIIEKSKIINNFSKFLETYTNKKIFVDRLLLQKSFDNLLYEINETISKNLNLINNLSLNSKIVNDVSLYYSDIIEEINTIFINEYQLLCSYYPNYELLDLSFNICDIIKEVKSQKIDELKINILIITRSIFNSGFEELKNKIKELLKEINENFLDEIKTEYENIFNVLTSKSESDEDDDVITINSLSDNLISSLKEIGEKYLNNSIDAFNNNKINNLIIENKNKNIEVLNNSIISFPELIEKINSASKTLSKLCEERFEKEQILFSERIEKIIESAYNVTISDFTSVYGHSFLSEIFEEILNFKIKLNLNHIQILTENYNELMISTLSNITILSDILLISTSNIYDEVKNEISNNLQNDISNTLINLINDFKSQSREEMTNLFVDNTIKVINNENLTNSFSKNIINLIPKEFTKSFIENLNKVYDLFIDNSDLGNFLNLTSYQLTQTKNYIDSYFSEEKIKITELLANMTKALSSKTKIYTNLKSYEENFNNIIPKNFAYSIPETIKDNMINFIEKIINLISPINKEYDENDLNIKNNLKEKINSFDNYVTEVITKLNSDEIILNTTNSFNNIKNIGEEIKTFFKNNLTENIENGLKEINMTLPSKKELEEKYKLRNLKEFEIKDILTNIKEIYSSLNNITEESIKLEEFSQFSKINSNFEKQFSNTLQHITTPVNNALETLIDYLSIEQYSDFKNNILNQSKEIKEIIQKFFDSESTITYNCLIFIKNGFLLLYNDIYTQIKEKTDNYLTKYIDEIFNKITRVNTNSNIIIGKENITLGSFSQDIFGELIQFSSTVPYYEYSYGFKFKYSDYQLYTELTAYGSSNIDVYFEFGDSRAKLSGNVGAGIMGLQINDFLIDNSVLINALQYVNRTSYIKSFGKKEKNLWNDIIEEYTNEATYLNAIKYYE